MMQFVRVRGFSLAVVVLVMFLIAVSQAGISYSVELVHCRNSNQPLLE
jgi:hypothetical protein